MRCFIFYVYTLYRIYNLRVAWLMYVRIYYIRYIQYVLLYFLYMYTHDIGYLYYMLLYYDGQIISWINILYYKANFPGTNSRFLIVIYVTVETWVILYLGLSSIRSVNFSVISWYDQSRSKTKFLHCNFVFTKHFSNNTTSLEITHFFTRSFIIQ
jgi:hypothetical protein